MEYLSSKKFDKQFAKFPKVIKYKCTEKIKIFVKNPYDETLNNHNLGGKYEGCRSINMTGDIRIIYEITTENIAYFLTIGSHSELYK